jgi:hypothetical protein
MYIPLWLLLLGFAVVVCMVGVIIERGEEKRKLQGRIEELEEEIQSKDGPSSETSKALEHDVLNRVNSRLDG